MGYVKDRIKKLSTEAGSKTAARKVAMKWFKSSPVHAQSTRENFKPGKIYVFDYTPITEDIQWFDKKPVVLAIGRLGNNDLGVNLNLLPNNIKEDLLEDLSIKMNLPGKSNEYKPAASQKPLRITYEGMENYLKRTGCAFAIRQYFPPAKKNQKVISYQNWPDILLCDFVSLVGTTVAELRSWFSK